MNTGIYEIINTNNGKRYVGSAVNFTLRWNAHRRHLRNGTHHNRPMQCAYNKYGNDSLKFHKLILCSRENLLIYEQLAIDALAPEFNTLKVAGNLLGFRQSAEARARMSASHTGKKHTAEARAKISAANKGQQVTEEQREKLRAAAIGRKCSAETRVKMSAAQKGNKNSLGKKNALGRKASPETRAKMSASGKLKIFTAEHRANMSAGQFAGVAKRKQAALISV